ncbi:hypothetical protein [Acinetobacter guerrae]|uniref:hypothetical protein n=1 Tax=Acinetobacter guerrae TaxID=1843371 RepID=UPI00128BA43B|nr:hypothetical protein [Acinetobacter guerrae]MPW43375.1 hypothetical protein [Acinetobacter guerrae]
MKIRFAIVLTALGLLVGCDNQPKEKSDNIDYKAQFEKSDDKISSFLDKLDDPNTKLSEQKQILCNDWPKTYKEEYSPALIKLQPKEYTQDKLDKELKSAVDFYKQKLNIKCE